MAFYGLTVDCPVFQCGFFVRKQRDEMEKRMQVEGKVMVENEDNFTEVEEKKKPL